MADEYAQPFPDYEAGQTPPEARKRSGRRTKEQERAKKARQRKRHRLSYRIYMKTYMAERRKKKPDAEEI